MDVLESSDTFQGQKHLFDTERKVFSYSLVKIPIIIGIF